MASGGEVVFSGPVPEGFLCSLWMELRGESNLHSAVSAMLICVGAGWYFVGYSWNEPWRDTGSRARVSWLCLISNHIRVSKVTNKDRSVEGTQSTIEWIEPFFSAG